jgi:gluconokinase
VIVVVMGVAGTGKTSVGLRLARWLHVPFVEGDDFHSARDIAKMRRGEPLTDDDRAPWIDALNGELQRHAGSGAVLACSALTHSSRRRLTEGVAGARFVFLHGDESVLRGRLEARRGHFAGASLLTSQLATLEAPPDAVAVDVARPPDEVFARVVAGLTGAAVDGSGGSPGVDRPS